MNMLINALQQWWCGKTEKENSKWKLNINIHFHTNLSLQVKPSCQVPMINKKSHFLRLGSEQAKYNHHCVHECLLCVLLSPCLSLFWTYCYIFFSNCKLEYDKLKHKITPSFVINFIFSFRRKMLLQKHSQGERGGETKVMGCDENPTGLDKAF